MVLPFVEACALASRHGFDAVNLDMGFLKSNGPKAVRDVLEEHGLKPGGFRFPVKLTDEVFHSANGFQRHKKFNIKMLITT
jgi:uncharacterized protein YecE (DUF72 family)